MGPAFFTRENCISEPVPRAHQTASMGPAFFTRENHHYTHRLDLSAFASMGPAFFTRENVITENVFADWQGLQWGPRSSRGKT